MSILEKLTSDKRKLEDKIAKEESKLREKENAELKKQKEIFDRNKELKADFDKEAYEFAIDKNPFSRFLILLSRYNPKTGNIEIPYFDMHVGPVLPNPKIISLNEAIKKYQLEEFAEQMKETKRKKLEDMIKELEANGYRVTKIARSK